jgi:hypothetical protein
MNKQVILLCLLTLLALETKAFETTTSSLTIFVYPPRHELNWKSPRKALFSFLGIEIEKIISPGKDVESVNPWGETTTISSRYRSTMGHSIAHVECTTSDGERFDDWSSFSGQDYPEVDKENILKNKIGLGTLFYDYIDGHIIRGEENINRLIFYRGERKNRERVNPRYLKFEITPESCDEVKKMATFYASFHYDKNTTLAELKKRDPNRVLYFTTNLDPYESFQERLTNIDAKVGGGCAPYAIGLMKAAELYDSSLDPLFKLELDVSEKLIGTPAKPVKFLSLILGKNGRHWNFDGYENRHMSQYDPQKIWDFVGQAQQCARGNECELEENSWYQAHKSALKIGSVIELENLKKEKSVEITGILIKKN